MTAPTPLTDAAWFKQHDGETFIVGKDVLIKMRRLEIMCAELAEALEARNIMADTVMPRKLDEALRGRENDELAIKMSNDALAAYAKMKEEMK